MPTRRSQARVASNACEIVRAYQKCFDSGVAKMAPMPGGGGWNSSDATRPPIALSARAKARRSEQVGEGESRKVRDQPRATPGLCPPTRPFSGPALTAARAARRRVWWTRPLSPPRAGVGGVLFTSAPTANAEGQPRGAQICGSECKGARSEAMRRRMRGCAGECGVIAQTKTPALNSCLAYRTPAPTTIVCYCGGDKCELSVCYTM